jgi:hypothetical protein
MNFQNAWVSDRTVCYLASGKPVVVQDTGPSAFLPNGEGMFRFSTLQEATEALATINASYGRHCRAARDVAETWFDGKQVAETILSAALRAESRNVEGLHRDTAAMQDQRGVRETAINVKRSIQRKNEEDWLQLAQGREGLGTGAVNVEGSQ